MGNEKFIVSCYAPVKILAAVIVLLFFFVGIAHFFENTVMWWCFTGALMLFAMLYMDSLFRTYVIDSEGVHQRWFFHTDHFPWDSFQSIFLVEDGSNQRPNCCLCLDRGISFRLNPYVDRDIHFFRFVMIELTEPGGYHGLKWCADKQSILSFLNQLDIFPQAQKYHGFLSG